MHNLKKKIIDRINKNSGSIALDKFIELCLFDKNGYYRKKQPIGKKADFTTAPEVSQLFGEILGVYILNIWQKYLQCKFNLIELGPGKGTLLDDILRISKNFIFFFDSINLNLIEINKELIKLQKKILSKRKINPKKIQWSEDFNPIKKQPSIIFANEFLDCFAIKQYINLEKKWYEKKIKFNKKEKKFIFYNQAINNNYLSKKLDSLNQQTKSQILEISDARAIYFNNLCTFIRKHSGVIIIIDYGYSKPVNYSTLQSIRLHRTTNILDNPGNQDITSLVNFQNLNDIAKKNKLYTYGPFSQKEFLESNGIKERKNKILLNASENQKRIIREGYDRLVNNDQMGNIFKCLIASTYKF